MRTIINMSVGLLRKGPYDKMYGDISHKKELDELFRSIGITDIPPDPRPDFEPLVSYDYQLYADSPEYLFVKNRLEQLNIPYLYNYTFEFTKEETEHAPLYEYAMAEDYPSCKHPSEYGTRYEKEVICPACGLNRWIQVSELRLDTSVIGIRLILYKLGDNIKGGEFIIISKDMKELLEQEKMTGYELQSVIHVGPEEKKREVYQLV